jgi:CheY-like chemotaxis protein
MRVRPTTTWSEAKTNTGWPCAGHCQVLIVEDEADLRQMMSELLKLDGFEIATVSNGREALDYLHNGDKPDLILLDLMMPVMDGWEFLRHQKADAKLAGVPVIVLSALDQSQGAEMNLTAYLKKPLDFDRLLRLVRKYCQ